MNQTVSKTEKLAIKESTAICREAALRTMDIELFFDEVSILKIDGIISLAWPDGPIGDYERDSYRYQLWGCFLGEAMCVVLNGNWVQGDLGLGVEIIDTIAYPIEKIEKRFKNGMDDSITDFYYSFKESV